MSLVQSVDVLVVGLGPAGASAAIAAAKAGCSVVAIERNAEPGLPVQCAEFVPMLVGADKGGELEESSAIQPIDGMVTYVEGGDKEDTPGFSGKMIDRATFL